MADSEPASTRTLRDVNDEARNLDAPLSERLHLYAEGLRNLYPVDASAYDALVERLKRGDTGTLAPNRGAPMLPFVLPDEGGRLVSSTELLDRGPLIVSFNRGHWCGFCQIELSGLAGIAQVISARGGQLISIVPEIRPYSTTLRSTYALPFPVLTDIDHGYALSNGLVFSVGDELKTLMLADKHDLGVFHGNGSWFLSIPATFVVDRTGVIRDRFVDPDFRRRMELDAILTALDGL